MRSWEKIMSELYEQFRKTNVWYANEAGAMTSRDPSFTSPMKINGTIEDWKIISAADYMQYYAYESFDFFQKNRAQKRVEQILQNAQGYVLLSYQGAGPDPNDENEQTVVIPNYVDGHPIVAVGQNLFPYFEAFEDDEFNIKQPERYICKKAKLFVPDGINFLLKGSLAGFKQITELYLSNTLLYMGKNSLSCFAGKFRNFELPSSLYYVEDDAFTYNSRIKILPSSLAYLGNNVMNSALDGDIIFLPKHLCYIGTWNFGRGIIYEMDEVFTNFSTPREIYVYEDSFGEEWALNCAEEYGWPDGIIKYICE